MLLLLLSNSYDIILNVSITDRDDPVVVLSSFPIFETYCEPNTVEGHLNVSTVPADNSVKSVVNKETKKLVSYKAPVKSSVNFEYITNDKQRRYAEAYYRAVLAEQEQFGIPASITLTQGMLESAYGESRLATDCNNHFGIKYYGMSRIPNGLRKYVLGSKIFHDDCKHDHFWSHSNKNDHVVVKTGPDDVKLLCPDPDRFVKYTSVWASFRHHSYILQKQRYLKYEPKNYNEWAWALKYDKGGYATNPKYHLQLIGMIKKLKLYKLDQS